MADIVSKKVRSRIMASIRGSKNTRTDEVFARLLREHGITGWRRSVVVRFASARDTVSLVRFKRLRLRPWVRPDFIFRKQRVAIFLDGCFWHGCTRCYRQPRTNHSFWGNKVRMNRRRDRIQTSELRKNGWKVARIWEHRLSDMERIPTSLWRWISSDSD